MGKKFFSCLIGGRRAHLALEHQIMIKKNFRTTSLFVLYQSTKDMSIVEEREGNETKLRGEKKRERALKRKNYVIRTKRISKIAMSLREKIV